MELQQVEQVLLRQNEDLATIKAKLFNGMTDDLKGIREAFQKYVEQREPSCPFSADIKELHEDVKDIKSMVMEAREKKKDRRLALVLGLVGGGGTLTAIILGAMQYLK